MWYYSTVFIYILYCSILYECGLIPKVHKSAQKCTFVHFLVHSMEVRLLASYFFFSLRKLGVSCRWYSGLDSHCGESILRCLWSLLRSAVTCYCGKKKKKKKQQHHRTRAVTTVSRFFAPRACQNTWCTFVHY